MSRMFQSVATVLFVIFAIAGYTLVSSNTAWATTNDQIQIGTYNLEFFTDLNPSTGAWCEQHTRHTVANIKALASFIDSLDIEVLALQEVEDAAALDLLLKYMPAGKYSYIISHQKNQCQRVAVLYQPKKVSLTYKKEIPLNPPGHHLLRNGLVVYGKVLPNGFDFTLVVIHLKAYPDPKSRATRYEQLKMLGDWVANYLKNPNNDPDLILAGDFNDQLLTDKYAFSLLNEGMGLKDLDQDAPDKTCTPDGRYYTDPIDHIIISPNAENEYTGTTTLDNYFTDSTLPYRESYSDHCILWSDFSVSDLDGPIVAQPPLQTGSTLTCSDLKPGDVIIYKLMVNAPGRYEIPNEYFTLLNTTTHIVDLRGITLADEQSSWTIPSNMTDAVIGPGETWTVYGSTYNPTSSTRGIALRNSGETVFLLCGNKILDQWTYPRARVEGVPIIRPGY